MIILDRSQRALGRPQSRSVLSSRNFAKALNTHFSEPYGRLLFIAYRVFVLPSLAMGDPGQVQYFRFLWPSFRVLSFRRRRPLPPRHRVTAPARGWGNQRYKRGITGIMDAGR